LLGALSSLAFLSTAAQAAVFTVTYCVADANCNALSDTGTFATAANPLSGQVSKITFAYDTRLGRYYVGSNHSGLSNNYGVPPPLLYGSVLVGDQIVKLRADAFMSFHMRGTDQVSGALSPNYNRVSDLYATDPDSGPSDYVDVGLYTFDFLALDFRSGFTATQNATAVIALDTPPVPHWYASGIALRGQDGSAVYSQSEIYFDRVRVEVVSIPEPTTWALLIGGFGMAGSALRRRRASLV
jgi:hypothetical protein